MVSEVQKYRAQFFQIMGLIFMTPFGKLTLKIFNLEPITINLYLFVASLLSLLCLYFGIILIVKGMDVLEEKG